MGRGYDGTVLWGTRYKIEKITGLISQQGEAGNHTVNDCGGIIWRDAGAKRELAGAARATRHETVLHSKGEYARGDVHTNYIESAFSLLRRGIMGSWHRISAKHLAAYLEEMEFRFNRRKNSDLFLDTLRHMISSPVLPFKRLTKETEAAQLIAR